MADEQDMTNAWGYCNACGELVDYSALTRDRTPCCFAELDIASYEAEDFEEVTYGLFPGGDPRKFHPDDECCTPEEIEAWKKACAEWEAGQGTDRGPSCQTFGDGSAVTGTGFGIGTYTWTVSKPQGASA